MGEDSFSFCQKTYIVYKKECIFLDILKFLAEVINFLNGKKYRAEQSTRSRYVTYRDSARLQRADWSTLWANLAMGYDKFVYKGNSLIPIFSMFQFPNPSLESVSK